MITNKYQVTEFAEVDLMLPTQWGNICYKHWLQLEIDRWRAKDFRNAWMEATPDGRMVAMFTDAKEMRELEGEQ